MKKILNTISPLILQLNILQLEEYQLTRFISWIIRNFFKREIQTKKALIYTSKVKRIIAIYTFLCLISLLINLLLFLILIVFPFIGLGIAVLILKPYELYKKNKIINETRNKIKALPNLKVVGITGSFGKTSTKEILYQIIKSKYKTLRTPESFNTVFGVAKVVDYELDDSYEVFICEMAAYKIGEIKTLCVMIPLNFGLLTGITTQHFERFGSLKNTIKAKFELVDSIKDKKNVVFNTEDENVATEIKKRNLNISENKISIENIKFNKQGSRFDLIFNREKYRITTTLFGFANIKNILLASNMALKLGLSINEIIESIKNIKPFDNRNVLINNGKSTIINNTYSSNIQSFNELIKTAKEIKGKKVLVTPGIVELGKLEETTHLELGEAAKNIFDKVILVGKNKRTKSLAKGLEKNYEFINDSRDVYFKQIEILKKTYDWIFLENDLTQNY